MALYKRWRRGTVHKISDSEYRVGPVPPENGITGAQKIVSKSQYAPLNYRTIDVYFKINSIVTPEPNDILNALSKIRTKGVYVSCYIVRPSGDIKKPKFRWIAKEHGYALKAEIERDMNRMIRGQLPFQSMTEYSYALLSPKYQYPMVVAWNFLEA